MLTVGDQIKVTIIDVDYLAQGVAKYQGYILFIPGVLEKEEVLVEIKKINKKFGYAQMITLYKISPDRVGDESIWGSLDLAHLSSVKQEEWQVKITKDTFKKILGYDYPVEPILTDKKEKHYRNKVVFHALDQETLVFGMYLKNQYKLARIDEFILAHETVNQLIQKIHRAMIRHNHLIKHIVFRNNPKGELLVTLALRKKGLIPKKLLELLKTCPSVVGITATIVENSRMILGYQSEGLYGKNELEISLNQHHYKINDLSFFQVNYGVAEKVYELIASYIGQDKVVIDAFSGVGSIGFYIANQAKKVKMIEIHESNIQMAQKNKELNQVDHVEIIKADVFKSIEKIKGDILVIDPPRSGLSPLFIREVTNMQIEMIVYLSCDVKTLVRDIGLFEGYNIQKIHPIKMFYQTTEIETLVILKRK